MITILALDNAAEDCDHIAEVATSLAETATDRLGRTKNTVVGAINTLKAYSIKTGWSTGVAYVVKDVVPVSGSWYICVEAHTAGATFAGDSTKWRVFQGEIFVQDGGGSARTMQEKVREIVSLADFPTYDATGATDSSDAMRDAAALASHIFVPNGTHAMNVLNLPSNTHIYGNGENSVIKPFNVAARGALGCDSGSSSTFITDLSFRNLKLLGTVATDLFSEQCHLLDLHGVKRLRIDGCFIEGARGDGVYLGGGFSSAAGADRHNVDVIIRDTIFDGVNNDNRNPISVIDVDGMVVDNITCRNWGRIDMPGGLDFEPNYSFSVIKNVKIAKSRFASSNGNRGHITFAVGNIAEAHDLSVDDCDFDGNEAVVVYSATAMASTPNTLHVTNCRARNVDFFLNKVSGSWWGLKLSGNTVYSSGANQGRVNIGDGTTSYTVRDVDILDNDLSCNNTVGVGISDNSENVKFCRNTMRGATQAHTRFGITDTATSYYTVTDNIFLGSPSNGICQHDASTPNPFTNTWKNNVSPVGVTHSFRAVNTDHCGSTFNIVTITSAPNLWPYGESRIRVEGALGISGGTDTGMLETHRYSSVAETMTYQVFTPQYAIDARGANYRRKAIDATTWDSWHRADGMLEGSASYNPPSVAANGTTSTTVTVTGAALGDVVTGASSGTALGGLVILQPEVTAANTVTVIFWNPTGGAIDIGGMTLRVLVRKN